MQENTLCHYGVLGMKWGIHRALNVLQSSKASVEQKEKAMRSLDKHYGKISAKIDKHNKKSLALNTAYFIKQNKADDKVGKYKQKVAKETFKAEYKSRTQNSYEKHKQKAVKLQYKISSLEARAEEGHRKVERNARILSMYKDGLNTIKASRVKYGKELVVKKTKDNKSDEYKYNSDGCYTTSPLYDRRGMKWKLPDKKEK